MLRRRFLQTLATVPAAQQLLRAGGTSDTDTGSAVQRARILPRGRGPGSTIGIVAPASAAFSSEIRDFVALCTAWGVKTKLGRNISRRSGYLSAPDEKRAAEFMEFIEDPTVDAVVCARGGYGVMRILPLLDFAAIRQAGKVIMGFSDITALLVAVNQMSGLVTFHGPVASSSFDTFTVQSLESVILRTQPPKAFQDQRLTTIQPGLAQGRLTGGNLAMVVSTLGTRYEIDTRDAILFLEEINEEGKSSSYAELKKKLVKTQDECQVLRLTLQETHTKQSDLVLEVELLRTQSHEDECEQLRLELDSQLDATKKTCKSEID
jgi:muramoyltetrapeptide carboxypeptidase